VLSTLALSLLRYLGREVAKQKAEDHLCRVAAVSQFKSAAPGALVLQFYFMLRLCLLCLGFVRWREIVHSCYSWGE